MNMEKPAHSALSNLYQQVSHILEKEDFRDRLNLAEFEEPTSESAQLAVCFNQLLDTIERKEKQLRRSEQLFDLISKHTADLIAIVDQQGNRIYNSPSYQMVLGYTPEELVGTNSYTQIHPADRQKVQQVLAESFKTGAGRVIEYQMQHKDGHYICFESSGIALKSECGEVECLVIVAHDISKRRQAEQEPPGARSIFTIVA
jgi:PAS domain S-box-containing protein